MVAAKCPVEKLLVFENIKYLFLISCYKSHPAYSADLRFLFFFFFARAIKILIEFRGRVKRSIDSVQRTAAKPGTNYNLNNRRKSFLKMNNNSIHDLNE